VAFDPASADHSDLLSADIGLYLARHGVKASAARGYGHSRLRELVLGGATRSMLEAMTVPVLMSH
jgi:hypothetical protein